MCVYEVRPVYLGNKSIAEELCKLEVSVGEHLMDHLNEPYLSLLHQRLAVGRGEKTHSISHTPSKPGTRQT